jgi:type II secretory pathway component PulF
MLIFVVPRLTSLYDQFDVELPITTRILTATSDFMIKTWPIMLVAFGGMFWAFVLYRRTSAGRHRLSRISLAIPIFGVMRLEIILTELTRTMSLMVGAGVPILDGIAVTAGVVDNVVVAEALNDVGKQIEKGFPISYSFAKHPEAFPFILSQMIAVGEETGKMDEVLDKVSHVFEVSSEQKVKAMSSLIEPLVMIVLGLGVAFLVISIILPIYNLTSTI